MPRLKFIMLSVIPLCLKFRGRIVGAVSGTRLGIYIASGLLMISSLLVLIILISMKYGPESAIQPEEGNKQEVAQQVVIPIQKQNEMPALMPQSVPKEEAPAAAKSIKGTIHTDFGWQFHEVYNDWRYHTGIDISTSVGQTVEAIDKGQVIDIINDPQSGLTAIIKNNKSTVYYGSLSEVKVAKDSYIKAGQPIGIIGHANGEPYEHLHLAIKTNEEYIDPKLIIHVDNK